MRRILKSPEKQTTKRMIRSQKTQRGAQVVAPMQRKRRQRKSQKSPKPQPQVATRDWAGGKNNVTPPDNSKRERILPKKCTKKKGKPVHQARKGRPNNSWDKTWYSLKIWLCSRPGVIHIQKCLQYYWQHAVFTLLLTPQQTSISRPYQKKICSLGSKRNTRPFNKIHSYQIIHFKCWWIREITR